MSQTMNKKSTTKQKIKGKLNVVETEEVPDLTSGEVFLEKVKPYASTIGLALLAGILGFVVIAFMNKSSFDSKALEWRELNNAATITLQTGDVDALQQVANAYPDKKAGLWASQIAGDFQLRTGLQQLPTDRESGIGQINKAKEAFQKVVDAPAAIKTSMLQRRSQFSLAYAYESLGKFDEAKALYDELLEKAPESAFASVAKRGALRSSDEQYAKLYNTMENWEEEVLGDAPGIPVEKRPNLDFPAVDLPEGEKQKADADMFKPAEEAAKKAAAEKAAAEKAAAEKAAAEKAAAEEAAAKKAALEKAAEEEKAAMAKAAAAEKEAADKAAADKEAAEKAEADKKESEAEKEEGSGGE
jgi:hypothetical protein